MLKFIKKGLQKALKYIETKEREKLLITYIRPQFDLPSMTIEEYQQYKTFSFDHFLYYFSKVKKFLKLTKKYINYYYLLTFKHKEFKNIIEEYNTYKNSINYKSIEFCYKNHSFIYSKAENNPLKDEKNYHLLCYKSNSPNKQFYNNKWGKRFEEEMYYLYLTVSNDPILDKLSFYYTKPVYLDTKNKKTLLKYLELFSTLSSVNLSIARLTYGEAYPSNLLDIYFRSAYENSKLYSIC